MASLEQKFRAIERESPHHSSLINFNRAILGEPLTRQRVSFYFKKLVDKGDYEKSAYRELAEWIYRNRVSQKQGFSRTFASIPARKSLVLN